MKLLTGGKNMSYEDIVKKQKLSNGLTGCFCASFNELWTEFPNGMCMATSGYWWIEVSTFRKRKHSDYNEDHHLTFGGGVNLIPFYIKSIRDLQNQILYQEKDQSIVVWWADVHRKKAYIRFLTKKLNFRLTHFTDVDGDTSLKVLMWKPSYGIIEKE